MHAEIRDLLEQLRRLQDVSTVLHVETLTVPDDFWQQVGKDFDVPSADVLPNPQPISPDNSAPRGIARSRRRRPHCCAASAGRSSHRLTLFNGQEAELLFGGEPTVMRLALKPAVSADRKGLRLQAVAAKPDAALDLAKSPGIAFEDGQSLLLDVTEVYPRTPAVLEFRSSTKCRTWNGSQKHREPARRIVCCSSPEMSWLRKRKTCKIPPSGFRIE